MLTNVKQQLIFVLMAMFLVAMGVMIYLFSGKNGTLIRNSLIAGSLPESAFLWSPGEEPKDFKLENREPPSWLRSEVSAALEELDPLSVVKSVVAMMHVEDFSGKPIRKDLKSTWGLIEKQGRGYCADYSKLFTAAMLAAEIPVREWALGHEDFGSGHTFNEVYISGKWVFVDSFNGMLIQTSDTDRYLSVLEFRDRISLKDFSSLNVVKLTDPALFFQTREEGLNYYARSSDYFYMIWGNNVFSYDSNPWINKASEFGRAMERAVAMLVGKYPEIRMLETSTNAKAIKQVESFRVTLYLALAAEILLMCYFLWLVIAILRQPKQLPITN